MDRSRPWRGTDYNAYADDNSEQPCECVLGSILVVDDDARMLRSVKDLLSAYGYDCLTAGGGAEALEMLAERSVDLLLLDLNMPGVNGYQVLKEAEESYPSTDVIIVSGETSFDGATQALRHGARDFLRKPYVPDELIRAIENTATRRRMEQKIQLMNRQLASSEQRYRFIVNNSPDIIYMLDGEGRFTFVNERISSLLGYRESELTGNHYSTLVHKEDQETARNTFNERRTGKRASHNLEFRLLRKEQKDCTPFYDSRSITVELSAMGVYRDEEERPGRQFIGTYGVIRDISERKRAEELVTFQLYHDLLTKLPNRTLFRDRLKLAIAQARRNQSQLAVMYLDMDRFKIINDSLGHLVGDQLLQSVAIKLRDCLRDSDTLARVGGDEFNLLLPNISSNRDAATIASKILAELEKPMVLEGVEVFISFSIGIAIYPQDGETIDSLVKHADTAMYHVKDRGKKNFEFYDPSMRTRHSRHLSLESGLRKALELDQLRVYYQPQVDIHTGDVTGVEALLRWEHPEDGLIMPGDFIPLAEETGLITDMGRWLLDNACRTIRHWALHGLSDITLAVNISARELVQSDFPDYVIDILNRHQVPGHQLELEITENVLMRDMDQAVTKLKRLAEQGIRIAVDDFGTGYSSLSYLQTLPLNTLKIDRSFISEVRSGNDSNTIIYAIVAMARGLGLNLVAEGVESEDQMQFLKRIECPTVQGYLTGRPKPASQIWDSVTSTSAQVS